MRLIDVHALGEVVDSHGNIHYEDILNTPTVDVRENIHGEWIEYNKVIMPAPYNSYEQAWKCSKCGYDEGRPEWDFCPMCGADMKGGE